MSDKARPGKPVVGSRNPTGRPRKVAGQGQNESPAPAPPVVEEGAPTPVSEPQKPKRDLVGSRRSTIVLSVVLVALVVVGAAEIYYLARDDTPTVSAQRPVVTGDVSHGAAVESAARSTEEILSTTYQDYDGQIDQATTKMTEAFAEQYRETSDGVKDAFIAKQTKLQVEAVAQGVVQASPEQVQVLLFLNQYVENKEDGEPKTGFAQYRALVTVVHTDQGWLVSDIKTQ